MHRWPPEPAAAMSATVAISDSVIGSLCREVDAIRQRCRHLSSAMERCQNRCLRCRLQQELLQLQQRRLALLDSARSWQLRGAGDPMALAFLIEICRRPVTT
jgi:hypothetical protein